MRASGFLLLNLLIFAGWYLLLLARRQASVQSHASELVAWAGLLAASQVVLFETVLGAAGMLRLPLLVAAHLLASGALLGWCLRPGASRPDVAAAIGELFAGLRAAMSPTNVALLALAGFLAVWMVVAAWFLPPRGADDLVYHLPPLYQYVQTGKIALLPLALRDQFAMPLGGDFLALWPLIFFHADTWVDLVQFGVAVYGACVLYALARSFRTGTRDAFFIAILFVFTPVVMGQAGSSYTDLTLAVCHLVLALAVVRFWQTGALLPLVMAGLASGCGLATKYNMLVAIAAAQPIIVLRLWRDGDLRLALRRYGIALLAALPLPSYWLLRNAIETGYTLYPYELSITGLHGERGFLMRVAEFSRETSFGSALANFASEPGRFLLFQLQDPGLGSLNGGFGAVFWGLGLPALAWRLARSLRSAASRDFFPVLFWGQTLLVVAVYWLQTDITRLRFNQRLILVVAGFGLLALATVIPRLRSAGPGVVASMRLFAVSTSAIAVMHLAGYALPSFQVSEAIADEVREVRTSPYGYLQHSFGDLPLLSTAWDPLDYLTVGGEGWSVYFAAPWRDFLTTPLFGSRLQNRVWNFAADPKAAPDALVYHLSLTGNWKTYYLGPSITPEQASRDPRYELVAGIPTTQLWVRRELLTGSATRQRLIDYYRRRFTPEIDALRPAVARLPRADALVTAAAWGPALKYLELTGDLATPVHLAPADGERDMALRLGATRVITAGAPLPGSASTPLVNLSTPAGTLSFFLNQVRR